MSNSVRNALAIYAINAVVCMTASWQASAQGLVAHYALDKDAGSVAKDSSPAHYDGKIVGATWVKTRDGGALRFDGTPGCVECGSGSRLKLDDRLTASVWFFPTGLPNGEPVIVGEHPDHWAITQYKGRAYFYIASGRNYVFSHLPYYEWSHVTGTFDGKTSRLYVNGQLKQSRELQPGTRVKSSSKFLIGGRGKAFCKGLISDVRVYNRVLSEKETHVLANSRTRREDTLIMSQIRKRAAHPFFTDHKTGLAFKESARELLMINDDMGLVFVKEDRTFSLSRLYGVKTATEYLSAQPAAPSDGLWQLALRRDRGCDSRELILTSSSAAEVSHHVEQTPSQVALRILWKNLDADKEKGVIDVEALVTLRKGDPLSSWRINVNNRSKTYGLWNVIFPVLPLQPIGDNARENILVVAKKRGSRCESPFLTNLNYYDGSQWPGPLNMQFQALYNASGKGLYLAAHDGTGCKKIFYMTAFPDKLSIRYRVGHYPSNMGYPAEDFRLPYDVRIGPFFGDWYDACQIYRAWALKQKWCSKGPLATRDDMPKWFKAAPIMLSTYTAKGDSDVLWSRDRAVDFIKFIGTDLPICWYTWKKHIPDMTHYNMKDSPWKVPDKRPYPCGNIHDGNYPYLPALGTFSQACKAIKEAGGHVKPYVCSRIYDQGLGENAPLAQQAKPHVVRMVDGKLKFAEARIVSWEMCYHTKWWQERMAETVRELIKREHAGGVYFDTFYGGHVQCFHTEHGHSHGGGADPYLGARQIALAVRKAMKGADPQAVMSGENPAETAIDLLDGFLMAFTTSPDSIPMLATVYGDYIVRFGRMVKPQYDGFYIQCAALFTEGALMGRLSLTNSENDDYLKDFDAGSKYTDKMKFLRKLARHYRPEVGARYLAYGQLLRPITFADPNPLPTVSYEETWLRRYMDAVIAVPALQSVVFKAADGSLGVFIVNIGAEPIEFAFEMTPGQYPTLKSAAYVVTPINEMGQRGPAMIRKSTPSYRGEIGARDVLLLEIRAND